MPRTRSSTRTMRGTQPSATACGEWVAPSPPDDMTVSSQRRRETGDGSLAARPRVPNQSHEARGACEVVKGTPLKLHLGRSDLKRWRAEFPGICGSLAGGRPAVDERDGLAVRREA